MNYTSLAYRLATAPSLAKARRLSNLHEPESPAFGQEARRK
jgi:hypothetical protein